MVKKNKRRKMNLIFGLLICIMAVVCIIAVFIESIEMYYNTKERMSDED